MTAHALNTYISGAMLGFVVGFGAGALFVPSVIIMVAPAAVGGLLGVLAAHRYLRWPQAHIPRLGATGEHAAGAPETD